MTMQTTVQWMDHMSFVATTGSGHQLTMDGAPSAGGRNLAPRPMELLLAGLGGCSSFDVVQALQMAGQDIWGLDIVLSAHRANSQPAVFERIHGHFIVRGKNLDESLVSQAITNSAQRYSSVSKMLEKTAEISYDYAIEESPR